MSKKYNSVLEMLEDISPVVAEDFRKYQLNPYVRIKKWLMIRLAILRSRLKI